MKDKKSLIADLVGELQQKPRTIMQIAANEIAEKVAKMHN